MPKTTYQRLSENKRKRFIDVCLAEYAKHGYEAGSVSNIVKRLGIAKGSVYQYFNDKADLYQYLVELSLSRKYEILNYVNDRAPLIFRSWFLQICLAEIKFVEEFHNMYRILVWATAENNAAPVEKDKEFLSLNLYKFKREMQVDAPNKEIIHILTSVKSAMVSELAGKSKEQVIEKLNKTINVLTSGMTIQS